LVRFFWTKTGLARFFQFDSVFSDFFRFGFGSVFIKKQVTKPNFFKKKTETGSNRPVSVRFGFFRQKPVWLGFFNLALFFLVFSGLGSVWFFWFQAYKTGTEPNRTGWFF
jgi:hypothetical protein